MLAEDLDILFCGTAAGAASARKGAYYAGPGNAFWPTLFSVGLTPELLRPQDYRRILDWKLGLTDLAKHVAGADHDLAPDHFDWARLRDVVLAYRPRTLAFTSKRAAAEFLGRPAPYGLWEASLGQTRIFVLPSPSGAARGAWNIDYWRELACFPLRNPARWTSVPPRRVVSRPHPMRP